MFSLFLSFYESDIGMNDEKSFHLAFRSLYNLLGKQSLCLSCSLVINFIGIERNMVIFDAL